MPKTKRALAALPANRIPNAEASTNAHERATIALEETPIVFDAELIRGLLLHRTIIPTREKEREMISPPTG